MFWDVAKKELASNITSPKVMITYLVCTVLIIGAFITGAINYNAVKEENSTMMAAEQDRLRNIFNFQQDYLQSGLFVYREPSVLSVLVNGVEGDSARRATITHFLSPNFDVSRYNSTPILAIFGILDLEFIVKIILSLFAILFTYDAISGEREMGTLKLNIAQPIKRSTFIMGKLIGTFLLLILPFIIPLLIGLLILQFFPGIQFSGEDWTRAILIFAAFFLYLLSFYSMGMMVSSLTRNSSVSFLILLMLWVLFIAVVPRVSVLVAQTVYPTPSVDEVAKEIVTQMGPAQRELQRDLQGEGIKLQRNLQSQRPRPPLVRNETTQSAYEERMAQFQALAEEEGAKFQDLIAEKFEEFSNRVRSQGDVIILEQERKQELQNGFAIGLSRVTSPAGALTFAANRLAKTGVYSSDKVFSKNVRSVVQSFVDANSSMMREHPEYISGGGLNTATEPIDVSDQYPDMRQFRDESFEVSLGSTLIDFASMAIISIIMLAISFVAFLRYDVR